LGWVAASWVDAATRTQAFQKHPINHENHYGNGTSGNSGDEKFKTIEPAIKAAPATI
jgi:hypothetical protein